MYHFFSHPSPLFTRNRPYFFPPFPPQKKRGRNSTVHTYSHRLLFQGDAPFWPTKISAQRDSTARQIKQNNTFLLKLCFLGREDDKPLFKVKGSKTGNVTTWNIWREYWRENVLNVVISGYFALFALRVSLPYLLIDPCCHPRMLLIRSITTGTWTKCSNSSLCRAESAPTTP